MDKILYWIIVGPVIFGLIAAVLAGLYAVFMTIFGKD